MSRFSDFDQVVVGMMEDFGVVSQLLIQGDGVFDPVTGSYTDATTSYDVNTIYMDFTLARFGQQTAEGTLIQIGDKQCFMQPLNKSDPLQAMPTVQANRDRISVGGRVYKIANLKVINPAMNDAIVYEMHLKE